MGMVMDGWRPIESVLGVLVTYEKTLLAGIAALSVLTASAAQRAPAAEEMPSFEAVKEFAHQLFEMSKKQGLSERETANHLASSMWWSESLSGNISEDYKVFGA
jgi:hypothetical protein